MHLKAQDTDDIYWIGKDEAKRESQKSGNSEKKETSSTIHHSNTNTSASKPTQSSSHGKPAQSSKKSDAKDKPKGPDLSDKLGKDRKLKGNEWERCIKEGLCLYCGKPEHVATDCNKAAMAKAHASKVEPMESAVSKKIVCNPQGTASQAEGCVDLDHVAKFVQLNVSALLDPDSFTICLTILKSLSLPTLLDSSSSDSFLDSLFVFKNKIKMKSITPIRLCLFNGTCNSMITETMELLITFPTGEEFTLTFYVTSLDSFCSAVLGYSWLQQYNLLIDWSRNHITFQSTDHRGPAPLTPSGEAAPL
jgi:hypothetical protein